MDLCLKPDITTFASGFAFTLEGERPGLKLPQENIIPGPPQRALLLPATFTGSVGPDLEGAEPCHMPPGFPRLWELFCPWPL